MYLLTIKDGLVTRHIGPYPSPKQASDDLDRVMALFSERARWQIHALECPSSLRFSRHVAGADDRVITAAAS